MTSLPPLAFGAPSWRAAADLTIGRGEARDAAQRELSKPLYHRDDPSLLTRALMEVLGWLNDTLAQAAALAPGGWGSLVAVLVILTLVVVTVRVGVGPIARSRKRGQPLLPDRNLTADEYRARAEQHASASEWAAAIRERLRAIARACEERGILQPRVGRTADELSSEAGAVLPAHEEELRTATRIFDDVWYGGRTATADMESWLRHVDERVSAARPAPVTSAVPTATGKVPQ